MTGKTSSSQDLPDVIEIDTDLFLKAIGIRENAVCANIFHKIDFHELAVQIDVVLVKQVDFQHLRFVFMEGFPVADVGGGFTGLTAEAHPGSVNAAWREDFVFRIDVSGGKAEAAANGFTVNYMSRHGDGMAEHLLCVIKAAEINGVADAGAGDGLPVLREDHLDAEDEED